MDLMAGLLAIFSITFGRSNCQEFKKTQISARFIKWGIHTSLVTIDLFV